MEEGTGMKKIFAIAIIFFVIGFGISWIIFGRGDGGETLVSESEKDREEDAKEENGDTEMEKEDAASKDMSEKETARIVETLGVGSGVAVDDQDAGLRVQVAKVILTEQAWVAIHEDEDGKPGRILGAQRFPAGEQQGVVDLLRQTRPGGIYYAVIHKDDGDRMFDIGRDLPVKDKLGNYVMARFGAK